MSKFSDEERARIVAECPPPEDKLAKWRREAVERAAQRDSSAWNAWCDQRIEAALAKYRDDQREVLAEVIAAIRHEAADDLERATRSLTAELADLKATLAELRVVLANERGIVLSNALARRAQVN